MSESCIVAMGGGGFSMEPENPLLDDYLISLAEIRRASGLFSSNGERRRGWPHREVLRGFREIDGVCRHTSHSFAARLMTSGPSSWTRTSFTLAEGIQQLCLPRGEFTVSMKSYAKHGRGA